MGGVCLLRDGVSRPLCFLSLGVAVCKPVDPTCIGCTSAEVTGLLFLHLNPKMSVMKHKHFFALWFSCWLWSSEEKSLKEMFCLN